MTATPADLESAVIQYRETYLLAPYPAVLITNIIRLTPHVDDEIWDLPGCYACYGYETEGDLRFQTDLVLNLLYIGKAPQGLRTRIKHHRLSYRTKPGWQKQMSQIQLFPVGRWWEASSLEDYLIWRFQPLHCIRKGPTDHNK